MAPSSIQLARLVQAYVAEPGASLEEKAARVGMRRNELLRAVRGTISRTTRRRLLAFFAGLHNERGQPAEILYQRQPQGDGDGPQFTD